MNMYLTCAHCGKSFETDNLSRKYCGVGCREKARRIQASERRARNNPPKPDVIKACEYCGKPFIVRAHNQKFCTRKCTDESYYQRSPRKKAEIDRPFTEATVYLCHKWRAEGESVRKIAETLYRAETQIQEALNTPLTRAQQKDVEEYFIPRRKGRR